MLLPTNAPVAGQMGSLKRTKAPEPRNAMVPPVPSFCQPCCWIGCTVWCRVKRCPSSPTGCGGPPRSSLLRPGRAPSLGHYAFTWIQRTGAGCIAGFPQIQSAIAALVPGDIILESGSVGLRCILDVAERRSLSVLRIDPGKTGRGRRRLGGYWCGADHGRRRDVGRCGWRRLGLWRARGQKRNAGERRDFDETST